MNKFAKALETASENEVSVTENGAIGYKTTKNYLLDLNFMASSLRNMSESDIINKFIDAYDQNKEYSVRWLFFLRDVREGMGERRTFRILLKWLAGEDGESVIKLIPEIAEYGRFDDLFVLLDTKIRPRVLEYIEKTFKDDVIAVSENRNPSLLGKWMPSINTSSDDSRKMACMFARKFGISNKEYRKCLSSLRKALNVCERQISNNEWHDVNYEHVPSLANLKYGKTFMRHDSVRRTEFLGKLKNGEVKVNSSVNTPADIVHKYISNSGFEYDITKDDLLEGLWKNLKDIKIKNGGLLPVVDVSGSMTWCTCGNSNLQPLEVAVGLGIYTSEHLNDAFKNKLLTFSSSPRIIDVSSCGSLASKIRNVVRSEVGGSTNIEATLDLVLKIAVDNNLKQKDIPDIIIYSDMEFDGCASIGNSWTYEADKKSLFAHISRKYEDNGYVLPKIIFWNLASRTGTIPIKTNKLGVTLVSGFSQNILKMVSSNNLDPWEVLKEQLDTERYSRISDILK